MSDPNINPSSIWDDKSMFLDCNVSRRRFLRSSIGSAAAIGLGATVPDCFADVAAGASDQKSSDNILVVVQLSGGNDGLNTVIPFSDDGYLAARTKLRVPSSDVLKVDDRIGLHPSLSGASELLQTGQMAIVQGVGYDDPNRSHFEAMDIWHTCRRKDQTRPDGWLGRYLDTLGDGAGGDVPAMHLGREQQPFAVASTRVRVPTVNQLDEFRLRGKNRDALRELLRSNETNSPSSSNELLDFLQSSTTSALQASQRVSEAASSYHSDVTYPTTELGRKLRIIAQLIDAGLTTRVYYVQLDGFDTHAQQAQTHSILLKEWSDAVTALVNDLDAHDHGQRVSVMTFSEFGRRVAENASGGTDHGAAGPMFLCGGGLQGGILGEHPSLSDLKDGDLQHQYDFRQVYASVLQSWLGVDPHQILGGKYRPLKLFA